MRNHIFHFLLTLMLPMAATAQGFTWYGKLCSKNTWPTYKVIQVWSPEKALVRDKPCGANRYVGNTSLLVSPKGNLQKDQIIKVPRGMEVRCVGTVQYLTKDRRTKTVPVIQFREKSTPKAKRIWKKLIK